ncbi:glycosyltransferase [Fuerstiella marisgermanici]|uniref:D-inositol 3-phosphate glycosyltransferase n=1 Tax=Fuerstiella marisgermanici TaxID=1891926 RepID=A0A1P8WCA3_9PLAN|nr:glycosyltransferase [Fuerstiella marisgermanici]APZ91674.1 D-inositol 3-phosphate glycosyltransferase [Fuerstiella marisgermanici]
MHVLFVHQNFPAQFGHIAAHLVKQHGHRCTFVSEKPSGHVGGIERIQYSVTGGARASTHFCSRTFENQIWHSAAVMDALKNRPDIQPDLIVGHTGFLSTVFLRELYDVPQINYFEFFYRTQNSDIDFRSDLPQCGQEERIRARIRNAALLLDLDNCDAGYSPTVWQRNQLPKEFHTKVQPIFDGIDTSFWKPVDVVSRTIAGLNIPADMKVVTYVSRGMESIRGFDIFMKVAKRLCDMRSDVVFIVVGEDRIAYGGDARFTNGKTFKQWVLERDDYDLNRIRFTGRIAPTDLVRLFSLSDLHLFLTAPFVLSWSLFDALACGATVLASSTGPVMELVNHEQNGLLTDFFDVDSWVEAAAAVLDEPQAFAHLGAAGVETVRRQFSMDVCLPKLLDMYARTLM